MHKFVFIVVISIAAASVLSSCTKVITTEQYVNAMSSIGCKGLQETSSEAAELLKAQGLAYSDIQTFRKKMDPKKSMQIAQDIATRVGACFGAAQ